MTLRHPIHKDRGENAWKERKKGLIFADFPQKEPPIIGLFCGK